MSDSCMKSKLSEAIQRWKLEEAEAIYEHEYKAVYSATSEKYGPVILKLNQHTVQLHEEYTMLHHLNGDGCCKLYEYDEEMGMLLEERLVPGTVLREEESLCKRIEVFYSVFSQIHREIAMPKEGGQDVSGEDRKPENKLRNIQAPNYLEWLEDIRRFCQENDVDEKMAECAKRARDICAEMFEKYPERMLLHGDLHHDNILLGGDGTYSMIDPKGVIGPEILDIPRFIMNEIDTEHAASDEEHMTEVVRLVSEVFGYPLEDVAKVYFMEVVLGNMWCLEDGETVNAEEIAVAEKINNKMQMQYC